MSRLALVLLLAGAMAGASRPYTRVFFGEVARQVVSGEVWVVVHGWGASPAVRVATITGGNLEEACEPAWPMRWEHVDEIKVLVAISERSLPARDLQAVDGAYGIIRPEFLSPFPHVYLSPAIPNEARAVPTDSIPAPPPRPEASLSSGTAHRAWRAALRRMGHVTTRGLVLPKPGMRTLTMLYPDGQPFAKRNVSLSLFGSRYNHCGYPSGIPIGQFTTDQRGRIRFIAPPGEVVLSQAYWEKAARGPAGTAFILEGERTIAPAGANVIVRKIWEVPEASYVVEFRAASGEPVKGAHLTGCLWNLVCGAVCGYIPMGGGTSDAGGVLKFRDRDLRSMEKVSAASPGDAETPLTENEIRTLINTGRLVYTFQ